MIAFVDTSAWYAYFDKDDDFHLQAFEFLKQNNELLTSDVVFIETCALLHNRLGKSIAKRAGDGLMKQSVADLVWISEEEFKKAWKAFKNAPNNKISFVDVSNKVIMGNLGISEIFAFDDDFEKLSLNVVPRI